MAEAASPPAVLKGPGSAAAPAPTTPTGGGILLADGTPARAPARQVDAQGRQAIMPEEYAAFLVRDLARLPSFGARLDELRQGMTARGEKAAELEPGQRLTFVVLKAVADWQARAREIDADVVRRMTKQARNGPSGPPEPEDGSNDENGGG